MGGESSEIVVAERGSADLRRRAGSFHSSLLVRIVRALLARVLLVILPVVVPVPGPAVVVVEEAEAEAEAEVPLCSLGFG